MEIKLTLNGKTVADHLSATKGHPMPYNQLFMLVEASGYQLEHGRKNNRPYIIIREL